MEYIIAYYNEYGYTVCLCREGQIIEDIYSAGNNKYSSATTDSVTHDDINCVPLSMIRKFARQTGKDIARKRGFKFVGVEYDKWNIENILTDQIWKRNGVEM